MEYNEIVLDVTQFESDYGLPFISGILHITGVHSRLLNGVRSNFTHLLRDETAVEGSFTGCQMF